MFSVVVDDIGSRGHYAVWGDEGFYARMLCLAVGASHGW